jgi:glycosyltransferase involved in cell wall biosynthesis
MKILLVADYAAAVGGAETSTLLLRDGLRARGHDVRVFASSARVGDVNNFADFTCFGTTGPLRTLLQTCNPWAFFALRRVLRTFQPDVVHVGIFLTQLSPLILPLLRRVPAVYRAHWRRSICPVGTKQLPSGANCHWTWGTACARESCLPLRDWLPLMIQMRLWWRWRGAFDVVVANSQMVARSLETNGLTPVIAAYNATETRQARPPLREPPTVTFAGRLVRKKGVDVLLRAFARVRAELPQARLVIAGDGPEMPALGKLLTELALTNSVTMCGHLTRAKMDEQFRGSWLQVVPSRYQEPFGMVAAEAMMRGVAVVASRVGGLSEIVSDGETGLLVAPEDADDLAQALLRLLNNRASAEKMGRAARDRACRYFSQDDYVTRFLEIFEQIIRQRQGSADRSADPKPRGDCSRAP